MKNKRDQDGGPNVPRKNSGTTRRNFALTLVAAVLLFTSASILLVQGPADDADNGHKMGSPQTITVDPFIYEVTSVSPREVKLLGTSGSGIIPEHLDLGKPVTYEGAGYTITAIGENALAGTDIRSADLGTVRTVAQSAFADCISLTYIIMPDSVESIGMSAFKGCAALEEIRISDSVKIIESNTFEGCASLAQVTIPNSVTKMGTDVFKGCISLKILAIPSSAAETTSLNDVLKYVPKVILHNDVSVMTASLNGTEVTLDIEGVDIYQINVGTVGFYNDNIGTWYDNVPVHFPLWGDDKGRICYAYVTPACNVTISMTGGNELCNFQYLWGNEWEPVPSDGKLRFPPNNFLSLRGNPDIGYVFEWDDDDDLFTDGIKHYKLKKSFAVSGTFTQMSYDLNYSVKIGSVEIPYAVIKYTYTQSTLVEPTGKVTGTVTTDEFGKYTMSVPAGTTVTISSVSKQGYMLDPSTPTPKILGNVMSDIREDFLMLSDGSEYILTSSSNGLGSIEWLDGAVWKELDPSKVFPAGSAVTVRAADDSGWKFSYWLGDLSGDVRTETVIMDRDRSIEAVFYNSTDSDLYFTITLGKHDNGKIQWSLNDTSFNDFREASKTFPKGTEVFLYAFGGGNYVFSCWTDGISSDDLPYKYKENNNVKIGALFYNAADPNSYFTVTWGEHDGGMIRWSSNNTVFTNLKDGETSKIFPKGTTVYLIPVGDFDYKFSCWIHDIGGDDIPYTYDKSVDVKVGALFYNSTDPNSYFTITLMKHDNGKIQWSLNDTVFHNFKESSKIFPIGTVVYLNAAGSGSHVFSCWTDEANGDANPYKHDKSVDLKVGALFVLSDSHHIATGDEGGPSWIIPIMAALLAALLLLALMLMRKRSKVSGAVTCNGRGLEGVDIAYTANGKPGRTTTDGNGNYKMNVPSGSEVTITGALKDGYELEKALPGPFISKKGTGEIIIVMHKG
ncbi:MAG: leucine-rich repeat domain-containing protein [Methanomassiliicoccaceae archaeon]|nr:leucine-rich repeat domain-containing protein [Methanomassiliicoccaceae archaeon]